MISALAALGAWSHALLLAIAGRSMRIVARAANSARVAGTDAAAAALARNRNIVPGWAGGP